MKRFEAFSDEVTSILHRAAHAQTPRASGKVMAT